MTSITRIQHISAEIVAIGTELLLGELTDTNSVYLARQLRDIGINVFYMTSVGDNEDRIESVIRQAMSRADIIITCGGLGPTVDDMTRQSIASATDRELQFHQHLYDQIAERFKMFNVTMTENNARQAYLPQDAIIIENPVGTAPSFIVEHQFNDKNKTIISLPGVPREMKYLFENEITPFLMSKFNLGTIEARILKTAGIGESSLDDKLGSDILNSANPSIGLAAHQGVIDIRITAKASDHEHIVPMLDDMEKRVRERVGDFIFGQGDDTIEAVLATALEEKSINLNVVEAGLSGIVHEKLPETAHHLIVNLQQFNHPNELKEQYPDVSGNNRQEITLALASQFDESDASIIILSDPDIGESSDDSMATVVVIKYGDSLHSRVYGFGGKSTLVRQWVTRWAFARLWQIISHNKES